MKPYRTAPVAERAAERPWPLAALVLLGLLTWAIVIHGLGALAGRW